MFRGRKGRGFSGVSVVLLITPTFCLSVENNYRAELPLSMIKGEKKIVFLKHCTFFFFLLYLKNFPYQYSFFNIMVVENCSIMSGYSVFLSWKIVVNNDCFFPQFLITLVQPIILNHEPLLVLVLLDVCSIATAAGTVFGYSLKHFLQVK